MIKPETMLKAARLARPDKPWELYRNTVLYWIGAEDEQGVCNHEVFNPHDPTKGDLAALMEAITRNGWKIGFDEDDPVYQKSQFYAWKITEGYIYGDTWPELAINVVEAMP